MPAIFTSTLISDIPLATGLPCTVAFWMKPDAAVFKPVCLVATDVGGTNDFYLALGGTAAQHFVIGADGPGPTSATFGIGTLVPGAWTYVMGRWITTTNRRIHILNPSGTITSGQDTVSVTAPTGMTQCQFGGNFGAANFAGTIAEFWVADSDVQPGGGVIDTTFFRQLAFQGPFSDRRVAASVTYYQPFIQNVGSQQPDVTENYVRSGARPNWTNLGATLAAPAPPLSPNYNRPSDFTRIATI